jgi:alpha-tubulin suppressor-like RCC1 family protein
MCLPKKARIFAWGRNEDGQLGLGHNSNVLVPTLIPEFPDGKIPARVFCGAHFSVILTEDGSLYTMGYCEEGQLGHGAVGVTKNIPTKVEIPGPVAEVTCGWSFVIAITRSAEIYGWGYNESQQLQQREVGGPVLLPSLSPALTASRICRIQAGTYHALGIREDGVLITWGRNHFGQLGIGEGRESELSLHMVIPKGCTEVASGSCSSYAMIEDGTLLAWGKNDNGQLGNGDNNSVWSPKKFEFSPERKIGIACFGGTIEHCFLVTEEGDLYRWGGGYLTPKLLQKWKWELPKDYICVKWKSIFQWLFLGKLDQNSPLHELHVEIIFNFVTVY